jgi:hypothetical protein
MTMKDLSSIIDKREKFRNSAFLAVFHLQFFGKVQYNHMPNGILLKRFICHEG